VSLAVSLAARPAVAQPSAAVAFVDVTVLPMDGRRARTRQTVIGRGDRIAALGPAARTPVPAGAARVDGRGKFLMPGLAEMHGHVPPPDAPPQLTEDVLFLYVANGITTVRGMLGAPGQLALRDRTRRGELVGPTLYLAGPSFNGQSINSPEEATARVRAQKAEGWDLLKVHPGLTRDEYDAMARTAKQVGMRFGGHVPADVGLLHAIDMGQETFEHMDGFVEYLNGEKGPVDAKKLADVVKRSKAAGIWVVPTNALWNVFYNGVALDELREYPELKYLPAGAVDSWTKLYNERDAKLGSTAENVLKNRVTILNALHKGGVKILLGTDAPQQFTVPGFSLHREIAAMKEAGLTNFDILKAGTVNAGRYFAKQDSFGTIEPGKRADILLLGGNPLTDLSSIDRIEGVMVRGRWFSRADLDTRLKKIEDKYPR
jgi:imidazolonepropionase-like amidohydrolase